LRQPTPKKQADDPINGKTKVGIVKNWSMCAILGRTDTKNKQKLDLCALLRFQQAENEQTLQ
jgi:hypothetical protein